MATTTRARPRRSEASTEAGVPEDATRAFFHQLPEHSREPLVRRLRGSLRFDLDTAGEVEHWYVEMDRSGFNISQKRSAADAVMHAEKGLFEDILAGRANATAAVLRGALALEGDLSLAMSFQRLFGMARTQQAAAQPPGGGPRAAGDSTKGDRAGSRQHRSHS